MEDEEESSSEDVSGVELSVAEIKKGLGLAKKQTAYRAESEDSGSEKENDNGKDGREADSEESKEEANPDTMPSLATPAASKKLRKELSCTLCLSTLYRPVVTSCGHTFCRVCLCGALKNLTDDLGRFKCPTCRKQFCSKCVRRFAVQRALWNTIQLLYPKLLEERSLEEEEAEFKKALAELNGDDLAGRKAGSGATLKMESFQLSDELKFTRNVIRDPNDYVMHQALSVLREPDPLPERVQYVGAETEAWEIKIALLELEEDEDEEEGGFPVLMTNDVDDRALLKNYNGDVEVTVMHVKEGAEGRQLLNLTESFSAGVATFKLQLPGELPPGLVSLEFKVVEFRDCTCRLEFKTYDESDRPKEESEGDGNKVRRSKYFNIPRPKSIGIDGPDTDDEEEELSEFEDDGFVVDDDEPIEVEDESSDEEVEEVDQATFSSPEKEESEDDAKKAASKRLKKRTLSDSDSDGDVISTKEPSAAQGKRRKIIDDDDDDDDSS